MENIFDLKKRANELRKAGNIQEALPIYENLWKISGDSYDGAGLLHCLRKSHKYEQAIPLAEELILKFDSINWIKIEVIWTFISGILEQKEDDAPLQNIVDTAEKILNLKPELIAQKKVVFKVLKSAKRAGKWNTVLEWSDKLNPDLLSHTPMIINGKEGWCDQSTWYNYKIRALIETGNEQKALEILETVIGKYPKNNKFFLRLKALALKRLNRLPEAEEIYEPLCQGKFSDWWLLHEYAVVLSLSTDIPKKERSLIVMYKAASTSRKLETCVNLYEDICSVCTELERYLEARDHILLSKLVRLDHGWNVSDEIEDKLIDLNNKVGNDSQNQNLSHTLSLCKEYWNKTLFGDPSKSQGYEKKLQVLKNLSGIITLGHLDRPYCFINTSDKKAFFCFKSDLPGDIHDGEEVIFDAIPSFDKKKNQQSWKARDVRKPNG
jgi:tetratricopeptide (TPR) repeat protein